MVVNLAKRKEIPTSDVGLIIADIIRICSHFRWCDFLFMPRDYNRTVHLLARKALLENFDVT